MHIFSRDVYCFPFPEKGVYVYGAGFTASYEPEPLLMRIPPEKEGAIRLGVLHGDLLAASGYNPVSEGDLRKSGLHYVALGHVHQPSPTVLRAGKTAYAYSGSPEGCGFDELGARGIYGGSILPGWQSGGFFPPYLPENIRGGASGYIRFYGSGCPGRNGAFQPAKRVWGKLCAEYI